MVGLINLFVSILIKPNSPAAQSDVALLDIAAGHFGHMEFMTSNELAFPFTREVAAMARATVKAAKERASSDGMASESAWADLMRPNSESWNDVSYIRSWDRRDVNVIRDSLMPSVRSTSTWRVGMSFRRWERLISRVWEELHTLDDT